MLTAYPDELDTETGFMYPTRQAVINASVDFMLAAENMQDDELEDDEDFDDDIEDEDDEEVDEEDDEY